MKDVIKFIKPHTLNDHVKVTIESVEPDTGVVTMKMGPAFVSLDLSPILEKGETGFMLPNDIHPGEQAHIVIKPKNVVELMTPKAFKEYSAISRKANTSGNTSLGGLERF